jgi:zinc transporter ZupT
MNKYGDELQRKLELWIEASERMHLPEYLQYLKNPRKILWRSFLSGIARGAGTAVGFTILGAIIIIVLQRLALANLPVIGDFLADIVEIVQYKLK